MELVPIIYSVLTLVAVLAITTILISYISFKIRQKKGLVDSPSTSELIQPAKFENPVKKVVQRITKPFLNYEPHFIDKPVEKPKEKHSEHVHKNIKKEYPPKKSEQKEKPKINNRLEIVKNSNNNSDEPSVKKFTPPSKEKKSNLKMLDENVLDKYDDELDDTMFTLTVKHDKDNKKK